MKICKKCLFVLAISAFNIFVVFAQQNNSMYLMHQVPESNLLNPAIPTPCKWYIGIPMLSSLHLSYANNVFSYNDLLASNSDGTYSPDINNVVNNLHWRNYFGTELHAQWLAIGYNYKQYSLTFTITEKNNFPFTYPKNAIELIWQGNSQFEGENAGLKGTGVYFNHYREYAISASKPLFNGGRWGIRAKLLFGKLNISTRSTDIDIATNENTFDLNFQGDLLVHSSLPIIVSTDDNIITNIGLNENVGAMDLIFNRKNPGFAIDLGIVYPYSDRVELSASIIDLGFIRWKSNLNTFEGSGDFIYQGVLSDTLPNDDYFNRLADSFMDSMQFEVTQKKYTTFLPSTILLGANYYFSHKLSAGVVGQAQIYRSKLIPSLTIMGQYKPFRSIGVMASYTAQYYSLKQLGFGLVLGKNPIQFYAITDNVVGLIWPLSTQSINLRFGFNIILGCGKEKKNKSFTNKSAACFGMEQTKKKSYMKKVKRRKK